MRFFGVISSFQICTRKLRIPIYVFEEVPGPLPPVEPIELQSRDTTCPG